MTKIDFKRTLAPLYSPPAGKFVIVEIPPLHYLMIDGAGDPNVSPDYRAAVEALYTAAYTIKFAAKRTLDCDYTMPPLEGLWWADDMAVFEARLKSQWSWTMMIAVPDFVGAALVTQGLTAAARKKPDLPVARLRIETLDEGRAVQTLHIGSYDDEGPILRRLHEEFLPANGLRPTAKHHEIYLGDPRRTVPDKLKTILRQPVRAAE